MSIAAKYIGTVKWFIDHQRQADYGFISNETLGDVFFHKKSVRKGQSTKISEGDIVVFETQPSSKHLSKLEAQDVDLLENVTDVDFLAETLLPFISANSRLLSSSREKRYKILLRSWHLHDALLKIISDLSLIDSDSKLSIVKNVYKILKEKPAPKKDVITKHIFDNCSTTNKLTLWLEGFHDILLFKEYAPFVITIPAKSQKIYLKKVFYYILEGKVHIPLDDILNLNTIDYETSELVRNIDGTGLDYSISIMLNVIKELMQNSSIHTWEGKKAARRIFYDIILKQIRRPSDILEISGFFDNCEGRCKVEFEEDKNQEGKIIGRKALYTRNNYDKPRLVCDGRLVMDLKTKQPVSCEDKQVHFWWCGNKKCYKPSRELHNAQEWEKYTLNDFLHILKINYQEKDYEIYLSLINHVNRFLKHIRCRKCRQILRPCGQSNYAIHGVTRFNCTEEKCIEKGKEIYISHCQNGRCEGVIDSRDCVKCKPDRHDQSTCGWYVCNDCHSCCSTKSINTRIYIHGLTNQAYSCHTVGHKDLGVICCNKCGNIMQEQEFDSEEYQRVLQWMIGNKDKSPFIHKSGQSDGKWWFLLRRHSLSELEFKSRLIKYIQFGFNIPNILTNKDMQLVGEPIKKARSAGSTVFTCINDACKNTIDFSNAINFEAIKSYHTNKFFSESNNNVL